MTDYTYAKLLDLYGQKNLLCEIIKFFLEADQCHLKREKTFSLRPYELERLRDNLQRCLENSQRTADGRVLTYKGKELGLKGASDAILEKVSGQLLSPFNRAIAAAR